MYDKDDGLMSKIRGEWYSRDLIQIQVYIHVYVCQCKE